MGTGLRVAYCLGGAPGPPLGRGSPAAAVPAATRTSTRSPPAPVPRRDAGARYTSSEWPRRPQGTRAGGGTRTHFVRVTRAVPSLSSIAGLLQQPVLVSSQLDRDSEPPSPPEG